MSGSSDFHLEFAPSFEKSLLTFEKETFDKHDKKGREEFRALIAKTIDDSFNFPRIAGCRNEPFPSTIGKALTDAGWTLHKIEFSTPRASGSARQGRYMFMVHLGEQLLVPLYAYTHKQFPGRVPDGELKDVIRAAVTSHASGESESPSFTLRPDGKRIALAVPEKTPAQVCPSETGVENLAGDKSSTKPDE